MPGKGHLYYTPDGLNAYKKRLRAYQKGKYQPQPDEPELSEEGLREYERRLRILMTGGTLEPDEESLPLAQPGLAYQHSGAGGPGPSAAELVLGRPVKGKGGSQRPGDPGFVEFIEYEGSTPTDVNLKFRRSGRAPSLPHEDIALAAAVTPFKGLKARALKRLGFDRTSGRPRSGYSPFPSSLPAPDPSVLHSFPQKSLLEPKFGLRPV